MTKTRIIQNPYPTTHWCSVPPEDKTNKSLCRPLPVKDKAPPPRVAPPGMFMSNVLLPKITPKLFFVVVGSEGWVGAKTAPSQNTPQALRGAWARGNPTPPALNISAKGRKPAKNSPGARSAMSPSNACTFLPFIFSPQFPDRHSPISPREQAHYGEQERHPVVRIHELLRSFWLPFQRDVQ